MNLRDARIVLRPRSLPDVIDLTLKVCHSGFARNYALWWAWVLLPGFVLLSLAHAKLGWKWESVWFWSILWCGVAQGVFTVGAGRLLFAERASSREVIGRWAKKLPAYMWTLFLVRLLPAITLVLSPLALILPFVHEAVLLEDAPATKAVVRSQKLGRNSAGAVIELALLSLAGQLAAVFGADVLGRAVAQFVLQINTPIDSLWENGGSYFALFGLFAVVPYVATARFLAYIDLRTRKEGWDLQLQLTAIRAEGEAA